MNYQNSPDKTPPIQNNPDKIARKKVIKRPRQIAPDISPKAKRPKLSSRQNVPRITPDAKPPETKSPRKSVQDKT